MTTTDNTASRGPWAAGDDIDAKLKAGPGTEANSTDDDDDEDVSSPFARMLAGLAGENPKSALSLDRQVEALTDLADRFRCKGQHSTWQFAEGHLVTPIEHAPFKGVGEPYVVLEILSNPVDTKAAPFNLNDFGGTRLGAVMDLRVARFVGDDIATFLAESAWFKPWTSSETVAVPDDEAQAA